MRRGPRFPGGKRERVYCSTQFPDLAGKIEHAQRSTFVVSAVLTLGMFVQFPHSNVHKQLHDEQEANLATPAPSHLLGFLLHRSRPLLHLSPPRKIHTKSVPHEPLPVSGTRSRDVEPTFGEPSLFSSLRIISPSPIPTLHR